MAEQELANANSLAVAPFDGKELRPDALLHPFPRSLRAAADPSSALEVSALLLAYLSERLGIAGLEFAKPPTEYTNGWEAYSYRFQLKKTTSLPGDLAQPLVARLYASPQGLPRVQHEFAVLQHLQALHFPSIEPLLMEESCDYFGGPFLILAHVPGQSLLMTTLERPWLLFAAPRWMAATHVQLHCLPPEGFPTANGCALTRRLDEMEEKIRVFDLHGLKPGLDWLKAHRPEPAEYPSILHLDFHPLNLIYQKGQPLLVLDWPEADVGDVHADVGTTLMFLQCISPQDLSLCSRISISIGRFFFRRRYLRAYRRRIPLDHRKLNYYRAWAAFYPLCRCGVWKIAGPEATGSKPAVLEYLRPHRLKTLQRYFHKRTGVQVHL